MVFLGLTLLLAGIIMNFKVLRRPSVVGKGTAGREDRQATSAELMASPPWLISAGLVAAGLLIIIVFH